MSKHVTICPNGAADRLAIPELVESCAHCADRRDAKGQIPASEMDRIPWSCRSRRRAATWRPPSMVGFGSIVCFTAFSERRLLRRYYDSLCQICPCSDTSSPILQALYFKPFTSSTSKCDGDLFANHNAASFKGRIPGQAVVFSVDLGGTRNGHTNVAP